MKDNLEYWEIFDDDYETEEGSFLSEGDMIIPINDRYHARESSGTWQEFSSGVFFQMDRPMRITIRKIFIDNDEVLFNHTMTDWIFKLDEWKISPPIDETAPIDFSDLF